jgi:hypothetical protein
MRIAPVRELAVSISTLVVLNLMRLGVQIGVVDINVFDSAENT